MTCSMLQIVTHQTYTLPIVNCSLYSAQLRHVAQQTFLKPSGLGGGDLVGTALTLPLCLPGNHHLFLISYHHDREMNKMVMMMIFVVMTMMMFLVMTMRWRRRWSLMEPSAPCSSRFTHKMMTDALALPAHKYKYKWNTSENTNTNKIQVKLQIYKTRSLGAASLWGQGV